MPYTSSLIRCNSSGDIILLCASVPAASVPAAFSNISESSKNVPSQKEMQAMLWLRENASENGVIAASPKEGFLINAVSLRKNIIDDNFLMQKDAQTRYNDVSEIYKTDFETNGLKLLNKYRSKYIILSKNTQEEFNVSELKYAEFKCFKKFYENEEISITKTWCDLE